MGSVSVVTLARGRSDHLAHVVAGLARQDTLPVELVIAAMQDAPFADLPDAPFPVRQILVPGVDLPLAAARNRAASHAVGDNLVFLDADCIPGPSAVADYEAALRAYDGLLMGEVLYLPAGATRNGLDFATFETVAVKHSDRQGRPGQPIVRCDDYRCFWSLNFGMRRSTFEASGGFDERYVGYGGEDTDFGKALDTSGVAIAWMQGARVYHQHHVHHMPPIHHLDSVVRNAELFQRKWGYRTMGHWLQAFEMMGLIDNRPHLPIRILRQPEARDAALTLQHGHQPYTNTATVIRALEQRRAAAMTAAA